MRSQQKRWCDKRNCMKKFVIIDGNSLVNRAFYAMPPLLNAAGVNCNAVFGFANILARLFTDDRPDYICVAFDAGRHTFRNEMYAEYKGTRKSMPEELATQMPILKDMLKTMKITILEQQGIEADDIIGSLTKKFADVQNIVVTGDRDSLQLINEKTEVWLTKKGLSEIKVMNTQTFADEWKLVPSQIIDLKALMGDASDNIPGVPGVGEKTAKNLLERFGTVDNIYQNIAEINGKLRENLENGKDLCYLSYDLATIRCAEKIDVELDDLRTIFPWDTETYEFCAKYEFNSLLRRKALFEELKFEPKIESKNVAVALTDVPAILDKHAKKDTLAISIVDQSVEFAWDKTENFSIELFGISAEMVLEAFATWFADKSKKVLVFSLKKLYKFLENGGIAAQATLYDVPLAAYLINSNIKEDDPLRMLDFFAQPHNNLAVSLFACWELATAGLAEQGLTSLYYDVELPLVRILYEMEQNGITIDKAVLDKLTPLYRYEIESIRARVCKMAGWNLISIVQNSWRTCYSIFCTLTTQKIANTRPMWTC